MKREYSKDIPFLEVLNQGFCDIEKETKILSDGNTVAIKRVKEVHVNWKDYADIRMYVKGFKDDAKEDFDKYGIFGTVWGANIMVKKALAQGKFLLVEEII